MGNPFNVLGGNMPGMSGQAGNMMQMVQQFKEFRNNFKGDPRAEVEKLLQSGKISQSQLNQAQAMARQLQQFLH